MVTNVILVISVTLTSLFCSWLIRRNKLYKEFQKNMNIHKPCIFYKNEEKCFGKIVAIFDYNVIVEDQEGNAILLNKTDIYPI